MRPPAEQVIKLTDKVCADLLDEEYAGLARQVVAKLARKRPSPLQSGRAATWAGGVAPPPLVVFPESSEGLDRLRVAVLVTGLLNTQLDQARQRPEHVRRMLALPLADQPAATGIR